MAGDDRTRFCSHCRLNVYNLSALTARQAEQLLRAKEARLCASFYRRADGTILTRDCPVGLRAIRRRVLGATARIAAVLACALGVGAYALSEDWGRRRTLNTPGAYKQTLRTLERWLNVQPPPPPGPPLLGSPAPGGIALTYPPISGPAPSPVNFQQSLVPQTRRVQSPDSAVAIGNDCAISQEAPTHREP